MFVGLARSRALISLIAAGFLGQATLGCSTWNRAVGNPLTCPADGGAPWRELSSPHFLLETDSDSAAAKTTLAFLEESYGALEQVIRPPRSDGGPRVEVVLFQRPADYSAVAEVGSSRAAYFVPHLSADLEAQPIVVAPRFFDEAAGTLFTGPGPVISDEARAVLKHELAHRLLWRRFVNQPVWFSEGMAQLYSTAEIKGDHVDVGGELFTCAFTALSTFHRDADHPNRLQIPIAKAPTVRELVDGQRADFYDDAGASREERERHVARYCGAWKLAQMLSNGPYPPLLERFGSFAAALEHGERGREAFHARFDKDWAGLETAFRGYLLETTLGKASSPYAAPPPAPPPAERALEDAEVHLLWARLLPWKEGAWDAVAHHLDEALARAPASPVTPEVHYRRAIFALRRKQREEADREIQAALAARPDDPRFLCARVVVLLGTPKEARAEAHVEETLRATIAHLAPLATSSDQLAMVALYQADIGNRPEALRVIERALRVDPIDAKLEQIHATVLFSLSRIPEARAAIDRALTLLPEGATADRLLALRGVIDTADAMKTNAGASPKR